MGLQGRLDGRKINSGFESPVNFTPTPVGNENDAKISAHLNGIDAALAGAGGGLTAVNKSAAYTAEAGEFVRCDVSGGSFTITLPASPADGDKVAIGDDAANASTYNITVGRNGENIGGVAEDFTIDLDSGVMLLEYIASESNWQIQRIYPVSAGLGSLVPVNKGSGDSPYTTSNREFVRCDVSSGVMTVTLPASPSDGDRIAVGDDADNAATNNITVGRNGENIIGLAEDFLINIDSGVVLFEYIASESNWQIQRIFPVAGGSGALVWSNSISSNTDAVVNNGYKIDAGAGAVDLTLPASPSDGDIVGVITVDVANTVTVKRNGNNIMGSASDMTVSVEKGFELVYHNSDSDWRLVGV